ncbi:PREDICTED: protein NBR1 homolog [Tarenaya hassleriana]|nr:PREDICTED: protein NBR1 homolog [Tarenaya hassleriana]
MASSSGAKFGQRVWVLIHVDASLKDSVVNVFHGLNLNASPDEGSLKEFEPRNEPDQYDGPVLETVTPVADLKPKVEESKAVEKEDLLIGEARPVSPRKLDPSSSAHHIIDLTEPAAPAEGSLGGSSTKHEESNDAERALLEELDGKNEVEQGLLKELEEMGFKETDLNKEVLRQNKYNLEQSVDALCGVSEWDPILEELREMGFRDSETNKRLLEKNNGSIMRAVMDLLTGDKA